MEQGKAAPVFFDRGALDRWGTAEVVDATDDGATGSVTVRYSGPLQRKTCPTCGYEAVAIGILRLDFCPACDGSLT
ncbi:MAG: hypothetical protein ACYCT1_08195 [Steroidobacteraceae bacterium]